MEIFIAALVFIGLSVFGLCFNIIFRKNGKFPETEISRNKEMRKLGIKCAKEDEMNLWGRKRGGQTPGCGEAGCSYCAGCDFVLNRKTEEKI